VCFQLKEVRGALRNPQSRFRWIWAFFDWVFVHSDSFLSWVVHSFFVNPISITRVRDYDLMLEVPMLSIWNWPFLEGLFSICFCSPSRLFQLLLGLAHHKLACVILAIHLKVCWIVAKVSVIHTPSSILHNEKRKQKQCSCFCIFPCYKMEEERQTRTWNKAISCSNV
jgi:hypothetical protein